MNNFIWYYHIRDNWRHPRVTVAILESENTFYRGVSICSFQDNPCKSDARFRALSRARLALMHEQGMPYEPHEEWENVVQRDEVLEVLQVCNYASDMDFWPYYKSEGPLEFYQLTAFERKLVGKERSNGNVYGVSL